MRMRRDDTVVEVDGLRTQFATEDGLIRAVDGAQLEIRRGETLAVVGESGCGKSVMARSILRLVDRPGQIVGGSIRVPTAPGVVEAWDLTSVDARTLRGVRGNRIAMVFQEPMTSLSLVHTIGTQIEEMVRTHREVTRQQARQRAIEMLDRVGIPAPERTVDSYPFQLSGGMRQRAMIAMALACEPELLIADEPTTALDVTTQAQILELLEQLQRDMGMAIMLITHDLGVAAQLADRVAVMYLGLVVEDGTATQVLRTPGHPYTKALLRSVPRVRGRTNRLRPVRGMVPAVYDRPTGCPFHTRCDEFVAGRCEVALPPPMTLPDGRRVRCVHAEDEGAVLETEEAR